MIVLALLLLIAAAALVVFIIVTGASQTVSLEWDALNLAWDPSALVVFVLGAVTLLLVVVALGLLRGGTKRKVEQRRELKRLRKVEKENAATRGAGTTGAAGAGAAHGTGSAQPTQAQPTQAQPEHDPGPRPAGTGEQPVYPRQRDAGTTRGQDTAGQDTAGQDTAGQDTAGQDTAGQDTAGQDTAGQGREGAPGSWHDEPGTDRSGGRHEAG